MRRLLPRPLVVGAVALAAVLVAVLATITFRASAAGGPAWVGNLDQCRSNPMAHVHDPSRVEIKKNCATFTGTVKSVRFVPAFDDVKITLAPTPDMRSYLPAANRGVLVADVIATDQATVDVPTVGSRISASGAWVFDKATKTTMLLPTYRIVVQHPGSTVIRGHSSPRQGPVGARQLRLSVSTPRRVAVGGEIAVDIHAQWSSFGRTSPASQIRLFTEMTTPDGVGVRWRAAETDTRGVASFHLVAIQVPAVYSLTVYAAPSKLSASTTTEVKVAKR